MHVGKDHFLDCRWVDAGGRKVALQLARGGQEIIAGSCLDQARRPAENIA
jgi:hypothetical protein